MGKQLNAWPCALAVLAAGMLACLFALSAHASGEPHPGGNPWTATPSSAPSSAPSAAPPTVPGVSFTLPGGVTLDMLLIPSGSFQMGSPETERSRDPDEGPVHTVNIRSSFYLGKFELTQRQWKAVAGTNPVEYWVSQRWISYGLGDDYPVYIVSWDECQLFLTALNGLGLGGTFRLPSEAEWEYACRAGTTTRFFFGDSLSVDDTVADGPAGALPGNRSGYMWWIFNQGQSTNGEYGYGAHPVGSKSPNPWGLHDMSGNLWEWCQDWYHDTYRGAPADGGAWATQQPGYPYRVCRGGVWLLYAGDCRSAARDLDAPDHRRFYGLGLRLAWTP